MAGVVQVSQPTTVRRTAGTSRSLAVRKFARGLPTKLLILLLLVIEVYPLFWLVSTSLKSTQEFLNTPFWSLPQSLEFQNYADAGAHRSEPAEQPDGHRPVRFLHPDPWCDGRVRARGRDLEGSQRGPPGHPVRDHGASANDLAAVVHDLFQGRPHQHALASLVDLYRTRLAAHDVPDGRVLQSRAQGTLRVAHTGRGRNPQKFLLDRAADGQKWTVDRRIVDVLLDVQRPAYCADVHYVEG